MKKTFILIFLSFLSFHLSTSAQVDSTIGLDVSGSSNYAVLAHQITDGVQGERLKVNAIYNWITHNIKYDVKALKKTSLKPDEVPTVLKKRKAVCDGYSKLFTALCEEAGIKAVTIEGYAKDWMFDNGDQFYIPRHAWNAVYVEGRWHLVEATWGAGHLVQEPSWFKKLFGGKKNPTTAGGRLKFKFRYDPKWMLMDPLTFRKDHLPTDPLWQLTDSLMPISIFEAGDTAIMNFNKQNNILVQNLPDLDRINKLDEFERAQETAVRITKYNPRYRVEMAAKYNADALDSLEKTLKEKNDPTKALGNAKEELKKAEKEIAAQKSTISTEYSVLKKKNKNKSLEAKEHIRLLRSDNKRLIANCKSKINTANSKIKSIGDKEDTNIEKSSNLAKGSKKKQTIAKKETDATSPELLTIEDNVALMIGKIEDLKEDINTRNELITETKRDNDRRLDSLVLCFRLCDSALVYETIARLQMHDDMDDEVKKWNSIVKQNRLQDLDSLQKYFIAGYDTVLNNYDALRKSHYAQLEEYRKAFKELEKYKRRNTSNTTFLSQYSTLVDDYNKSNEDYMQLLSDNKVYIMEHKSLFNNIVDLYKRQEKLAEYMEKAEDMRKKLEEKNLAHKEEFDKKENEKQREAIKQTTKRIEKVLASK